uniref:LysR substrate-binding domain-containing protein n=1 Tax=Salmonella enterica TaxID=28901 RepID=UPI003297B9DB
HHAEVPDLTALAGLSFREELHAIEAAVAGQGVALCSDVLIASELASGALIPLSDVVLTGYGFYIVYRKGHPMTSVLRTFTDWACGAT